MAQPRSRRSIAWADCRTLEPRCGRNLRISRLPHRQHRYRTHSVVWLLRQQHECGRHERGRSFANAVPGKRSREIVARIEWRRGGRETHKSREGSKGEQFGTQGFSKCRWEPTFAVWSYGFHLSRNVMMSAGSMERADSHSPFFCE